MENQKTDKLEKLIERIAKVKEQIEWEKAQISFFDTEETA